MGGDIEVIVGSGDASVRHVIGFEGPGPRPRVGYERLEDAEWVSGTDHRVYFDNDGRTRVERSGSVAEPVGLRDDASVLSLAWEPVTYPVLSAVRQLYAGLRIYR